MDFRHRPLALIGEKATRHHLPAKGRTYMVFHLIELLIFLTISHRCLANHIASTIAHMSYCGYIVSNACHDHCSTHLTMVKLFGTSIKCAHTLSSSFIHLFLLLLFLIKSGLPPNVYQVRLDILPTNILFRVSIDACGVFNSLLFQPSRHLFIGIPSITTKPVGHST